MKCSLIVCTRNRAESLMRCLDSMAQAIAEVAPVEAEILVVDNGSTDATANRVTEWIEHYDGEARCISEPRPGVSYARNRAIQSAKGELLILTDDDCCLDRYFLRDALRYDEADNAPVLRGGRVELGDASDLPLTIKTDETILRWHKSANDARHHDLGNTILGCNVAMRKSLAESLGGFDEHLGAGMPIPSGEDTDFIFRAYLAGYTVEYVPDMAVRHYHGRKTVEQGRKLMVNYALGKGAVYGKFLLISPTMCRQFYWDFKDMVRNFFGKKHYKALQAYFEYRHQIYYNIIGMAHYYVTVITRRFSRV